jgi:hypothetical protein
MPITSRVCLCYYKNEPLMVNFKFAKFHCYQQNTVEEGIKKQKLWPSAEIITPTWIKSKLLSPKPKKKHTSIKERRIFYLNFFCQNESKFPICNCFKLEIFNTEQV